MPPAGSGAAIITPFRTFQTSQGRLLQDDEEANDSLPLSCIFKGGRMGCLVREESIVEVFSLSTGNLIGCKKFDTEIRDLGSRVTCVKDCWFGRKCSLLVGMETSGGVGLLCVFNFISSKILQIIEIPQKISGNVQIIIQT